MTSMTMMKKKSDKPPNTTKTTTKTTTIPGLNITTAIVLWLVVTTIGPFVLLKMVVVNDNDNHDTKSPTKLGWSILGFNNLNIWVALCEIVLGLHIKQIQKDYQYFQKVYCGCDDDDDDDDGNGKGKGGKKKQYQAAFDFLLMPLNISTLFDGKLTWSKMWSTYALWDPSYQNQESFGFFIDVGNGWSTIPPCIVWNIAILYPKLLDSIFGGSNGSPTTNYTYLLVGVLGCCCYWQILYGTIIYFVSFIYNKRYEKRPLMEVLGFVGIANGIWFVFPIIALYASIIILKERNLLILFVQ